MIKKLILIICLLGPFYLYSQISISSQMPPAGMVPKEFLWNLVLTNNKDEVLPINILLNVQDAITGELLMSANTAVFYLGKGVKVTSVSDVQPVQYSYNAPQFNRAYLPVGSYLMCYRLYWQEAVIGEECIKVNIDPLSPPLLSYPADKSEIESPYPQFTWMPPSTVDMFDNLNYDILVTEVIDGQSPAEAIQFNSPVYFRTDLKQAFEMYPSGFTALQYDKTYAWQVVAKNNLSYTAKTDVWTFKLRKNEKPIDIVTMMPFLQFKRSAIEKGVAPNGILKIAYNNRTADTTARIEIIEFPIQGKNRTDVHFDVQLIPGENNIQYDLTKLFHPEENKVYIAHLINGQAEEWSVQFVLKNYKK